jgi:hypothetical protein
MQGVFLVFHPETTDAPLICRADKVSVMRKNCYTPYVFCGLVLGCFFDSGLKSGFGCGAERRKKAALGAVWFELALL